MKAKAFIPIAVLLGLALPLILAGESRQSPVTLSVSSLHLKMGIDDKIRKAQLIVIGEVQATLPSGWKAPEGSDPTSPSPEEVSRARGLFTDSIFSVRQVLKGELREPVVRVRTFTGKIGNVQWLDESQPTFEANGTYLLFLARDIGATANTNAGDYVSVNAKAAVYRIDNGKAISADDEWNLEDLIAYIQKSVSISTPEATVVP